MDDKKDYTVTDTWSVEDILTIDPTLTVADCVEILQQGERNYNAELGYNWDYWETFVDDFIDGVDEEVLQ